MAVETDRRTLIACAAGLGAAAIAPASFAKAAAVLKLHDPDDENALALADRTWPDAGPPIPVAGERIPFGRRLFAARPARVLAVTRFADFHLLEEVGREAGYRATLVDRIADSSGSPALFVWTAQPHG
jgi:hypothetical protein